jgi:putative ABC transport system ATP-binding protein
MSEPIAFAQDLVKDYDLDGAPVHAVRGVTLQVGAGDFVAIMGPSGCGKSTLLHLLGAVDVPTSGTLRLLGRDARTLRDAERTALRLGAFGFVFQRFFLLPMLSAEENVSLPLREAGVPARERDARVAELLARVGLEHRARHRPGQLSGGEQQRVAIARALANRPRLLLADEPTGERDEATGEDIFALLESVHASGTAIVLVTHNPDLASRAGRCFHMRDGRFVPSRGATPGSRCASAAPSPNGPGARCSCCSASGSRLES